MRAWTVGQKIGAGFAAVILLVAVMTVVSLVAADNLGDAEDLLNRHYRARVAVEELRARVWEEAAAFRGYLLTRDPQHLVPLREARQSLDRDRERIAPLLASEEGRQLFEEVVRSYREWLDAMDSILGDAGAGGGSGTAISEQLFNQRAYPLFRDLLARIDTFVTHQEERGSAAQEASQEVRSWSLGMIASLALLTLVVAIILAVAITRGVGEQVRLAITQVQSSAAELQAASKQQATSSRQQATATAEVTSTLKELVVTSRQIADSARQVAELADDAAEEANASESLVQAAQASMEVIQRQVDTVVEHMLELGRKSQRAGGILDIINELAEQTNILAINATIESAGAGEAGRRFLVVAEEIRKLADRVGESSREIRAVIEDMRASANTTVMATEEGAKSVEAGSRRVNEMAGSFRTILRLVGTTTEATQEIELSTKQQTSAVEQVNSALEDVGEAARETEAAAKQALEMSSQLNRLSRDLSRMVRRSAET